MRILAADVGTGTQDILLCDSATLAANAVKMVVPSPSLVVARRIAEATAGKRAVLLTGVNMGGGPNKSALKRHIRAGLAAYATAEAACTFDDDVEEVERMGVTIVGSEEARGLRNAEVIELKDVDLAALERALLALGVEAYFDAIAVAVLDHGAAPPGVSDRLFRFEHLQRLMAQRNELATWGYLAEEVPDHLTRMKAVVQSLPVDVPLLLLDTTPAAALGALLDGEVARHGDRVIINAGNSHTSAFHLHGGAIQGLFEHHTHLLDAAKVDSLVNGLVAGVLSCQRVYEDGGHGCAILSGCDGRPFVAITGPRQALMNASTLSPRFAVPHGDTMMAGCLGLIRAFAEKVPRWREEILQWLAS